MLKPTGVTFAGTGSFVPEKIMSNQDLEKMVDTSDEWIRTRTGIKERRLISDGAATSDLAYEASRRALEAAKIKPEDLDLIIVGTITPDYFFPSTACILQNRLGANGSGAFDLLAACSGFIYGVSAASEYLARGSCKTALIVGAEALSTFTDYTDRGSCVLFGDGAGAAVLVKTDEPRGVLYTTLGADGSGAEYMILPAGGSRLPASHQTVDRRLHYMKIRGRETFKFAVTKMQDLLVEAIERLEIAVNDIALVIPHQVNIRILDAAAKKIHLPKEKMYINIDRYGNTSAASVPIALDEANREGRLSPGDIVILVAFGGGLTWASAVIRW
ncbi:MAG: 3-oxoacyl-ACP synthase [Planctomycetes bacterium DG_23]|nr:MAG: 3-oxoacyl-ACP synthase [Planctomycetes bacterium DG_23]